MALLSGQSWSSNCPYLWDHCGKWLCDGCQADAEQQAGSPGAGWVRGTTAEQRHQAVRRAAGEPGSSAMEALMRDGTGWLT